MYLVLVGEWVGGEMLSMGRGVGGQGRCRGEDETDERYRGKKHLDRKLIIFIDMTILLNYHNVHLAQSVTTDGFSLSPPLYIQTWHWSCMHNVAAVIPTCERVRSATTIR